MMSYCKYTIHWANCLCIQATLFGRNTHKVSIGDGLKEILQAVVWVNSREVGSTVHTQVLYTLVSLRVVRREKMEGRREKEKVGVRGREGERDGG